MLRDNFLRARLECGDAVIGTWAVIPSAVTADVIASSGMDFVVIDCEHGPVGFETAQGMVVACESRAVSPVIRVGGVIEADILRALDVGAHAIHVPNVRTADDARRIIEYAKYPPAGKRGFSPFTRAGGYSAANSAQLTSQANGNTLVCIHIEGQDAVDRIDSFLEVDGVDIVFVGLYDLSTSMGLPGQVDHPDVREKLQATVDAVAASGRVPGTIANSVEQMKAMLDLGIRYLTYSVDCEMLRRSYQEAATVFAAAAGRVDTQR